jgi:hypothetical protein
MLRFLLLLVLRTQDFIRGWPAHRPLRQKNCKPTKMSTVMLIRSGRLMSR